jgi:hypothetical protein
VHILGANGLGLGTTPFALTVDHLVNLAGDTMRAAGRTTEAIDDTHSGELLHKLWSPISLACALGRWETAASRLLSLPRCIRTDAEFPNLMRR